MLEEISYKNLSVITQNGFQNFLYFKKQKISSNKRLVYICILYPRKDIEIELVNFSVEYKKTILAGDAVEKPLKANIE